MQILLSTGVGYKTHTLREIEALALGLGYDGVELMLPPRHLSAAESDRDTSYETLTAAPVVHAPGDIYDQARFRAALDDAVGVAQMIGAQIVNIHPPALAQGGVDNVVAGITYLKEVEQESGVTIAYEVLVDPAGIAIDRQAAFFEQQAYPTLLEWVGAIKDHHLAATLDTCHVATWGEDPTKYIEVLGEQLLHVHFSDYSVARKEEHLLPGTGDIELVPFLRTLVQQRPNITITVEIQPGITPDDVASRSRRSLSFIQHAVAA